MFACGKLNISVCDGVMSELAQGLRDSRKINSNCFHKTIFNHSVFQRISQRHPLLFSNHSGNIFFGAHSLGVQHFLNRHGFESYITYQVLIPFWGKMSHFDYHQGQIFIPEDSQNGAFYPRMGTKLFMLCSWTPF